MYVIFVEVEKVVMINLQFNGILDCNFYRVLNICFFFFDKIVIQKVVFGWEWIRYKCSFFLVIKECGVFSYNNIFKVGLIIGIVLFVILNDCVFFVKCSIEQYKYVGYIGVSIIDLRVIDVNGWLFFVLVFFDLNVCLVFIFVQFLDFIVFNGEFVVLFYLDNDIFICENEVSNMQRGIGFDNQIVC